MKQSLLLLPLALAGCASLTGQSAPLATAEMVQSDGRPAGTATLVEDGNGLALDMAVDGLPAGTRGFHLHTVGLCDRPAFESAGGHLNPLARQHGTQNPAGAHVGDLPNIRIAASGTTRTRIPLRGERAGLLAQIFDADGTSVMIHAQQDDYRTDPTGDAGARIACGVMKRT